MIDTMITITGNLVADPRLVVPDAGHPRTSFRIASTPRRFDREHGEWRDGSTLYANVTCWRALAENVAGSLKKGQEALIYGRVSVREYETHEGEKRQSIDIDASAVGASLGRVVTVVKHAERAVLPVGPARNDAVQPSPAEDAPSAPDLSDADPWWPAGDSEASDISDEFAGAVAGGPEPLDDSAREPVESAPTASAEESQPAPALAGGPRRRFGHG